jgi:uncharacterized protein YqhQ
MSQNGTSAASVNGAAKGEIKFSYGGQAVIEGVMMRGAHAAAIAVRDPKGQIQVHEQPLNATLYRGRISKTPFVRGIVGLWDALGLGTRALMWAADVALGEEEESVNFNGPIGWATIAVSLIIGLGLFFLLPTTAATGIGRLLNLTPDGAPPAGINAVIITLIEGAVQLALLIGYIWAIGRIPDVKRLFGYHGAEHKTINAYEAGAELTPEVVAHYPIEHPRCGTAFLLTVVLVSVFVFSLVRLLQLQLIFVVLSRIILIPVIAGIAYEMLRFTARNIHNPIIRVIIKPNLALQHLTTRQPELHMIEVAIVAFKRVLVSEGLLAAEDATIPEPRPEAVSPTLAAATKT